MRGVTEGITSVLSALGFLNPGLHLMQTLFILFKPWAELTTIKNLIWLHATLASLAFGTFNPCNIYIMFEFLVFLLNSTHCDSLYFIISTMSPYGSRIPFRFSPSLMGCSSLWSFRWSQNNVRGRTSPLMSLTNRMTNWQTNHWRSITIIIIRQNKLCSLWSNRDIIIILIVLNTSLRFWVSTVERRI